MIADGVTGLVYKVLRDADPLNYLSLNPEEMYEEEAEMVADRLEGCFSWSQVQVIVHAVFLSAWGADHAGEVSDYREVAQKIWLGLTEHA